MTQELSQLVGELGLRAHPILPHSSNITTYFLRNSYRIRIKLLIESQYFRQLLAFSILQVLHSAIPL